MFGYFSPVFKLKIPDVKGDRSTDPHTTRPELLPSQVTLIDAHHFTRIKSELLLCFGKLERVWTITPLPQRKLPILIGKGWVAIGIGVKIREQLLRIEVSRINARTRLVDRSMSSNPVFGNRGSGN